jgi:GT2 family glycosyltransferase
VDADSHPSPALFQSVAEQISSGKCLAGGCTVKLDGHYPKANLMIGLWNGISRSLSWMAGSFIFCEARAFGEIGGFSKELFAGEEIDLSIRLKRLARKHKRRIVILHRNPLVTSARKMHLYTFGEHLRFLIKASFFRNRILRSREACFTWYDGRR